MNTDKIVCEFCGKSFAQGRGIKIHVNKCKGKVMVQEVVVAQEVVPEPEEIVFELPVEVPEVAVVEEDDNEQIIRDIVNNMINDVLSGITTESVQEVIEDEEPIFVGTSEHQDAVLCACCGHIVQDLAKAKVQCHQCVIGTPVNIDDVQVQKQVVLEDLKNQVVFDFKPFVEDREILIFAPTVQEPRRYLRVENLDFQIIEDKKITEIVSLDAWRYRQTVSDLQQRIEGPRNGQPVREYRGSLFTGVDLKQDDLIAMFQANPQAATSKPFGMKMILDHKPKIITDHQPTVVFLDTETSAFDFAYNAVPMPTEPGHRICMVQFLISEQGKKPVQFLFHLAGYQINGHILAKRFPEVEVVIKPFENERAMVDSFWHVMMDLQGQVILTGFNAVHDPMRCVGDMRELPTGFCGYDLKWLTARTSWKFTPRNQQVTVNPTIGSFVASQIVELPNILCVDFQAVLLKSMPPSEVSKLPSMSLKEILLTLNMDEGSQKLLKEDQNIYELQRNMHQQTLPTVEKLDMTKDAIYGVNDTYVLFKCEQLRGSLYDQTLAVMEFNQVGLSASSTWTSNMLNQLEVNRLRRDRGMPYLIKPIDPKSGKITGAYTNNDANFAGVVSTFVLQLDYASLYPNVIRHFCIDHENLVGMVQGDDIKKYQNDDFCIVEVSDDNLFKRNQERSFTVFRRDPSAVLPTLINTGLEKRKMFKKKAEEAERVGDIAAARKFNSLQLLAKAANNAIYGALGAKTSPLYGYLIACSVTAGARFALQMANRTIHQTIGFGDKSEADFTGVLPMVKQEQVIEEIDGNGNKIIEVVPTANGKKTKTIAKKVNCLVWSRTMFNEHPRNRILQNDTDSAFFTMEGTSLHEIIVENPDAFPKGFGNFLVLLRNRLNENLRTQGSVIFGKISVDDLLGNDVQPDRDQPVLMMECEEIVLSNFTSQAKKSYARCDAIAMKRKGQKDVPFSVHLAETMKMITENGKMSVALLKQAQAEGRLSKVMVKGVQWSHFHEWFRNQIRDLFLQVLVRDDPSKIKMIFKEKMLREFKCNLDAIDHESMERFATRVKRSGKSGKAIALQTRYPDITDNYVHVLPLKRLAGAKQMAGDLIIPVQKITAANNRNIDLSRVLDTFESQWTKFFVADRSKVKNERKELVANMSNNEVMIRVETARNPQAMHVAMIPDEVLGLVNGNQDKCCHEVIYRPITKLFFDVDEPLNATKKFDLVRFERAVVQRLEDNGFDAKDLQIFVSQREDTRKKISMHIAFDIVMPLEISKRIAIAMKSQFPAIDIQLYAVGKTLRVNGSKKIGDPSSVITSRWSLKETLVTYVEGFRTVEEPIALSQVPVINYTTTIEKVFITGNEPAEFLEIAANLILKPETANEYFKKASIKTGSICPACQQLHDDEDDWKLTLYQTQKEYVIRCFRDRAVGGESVHRVPLSKEQKKARRDAAKDKDIDIETEFMFSRMVPTQNDEHVHFDLLNYPLVAVKAQMGSGKTHRMIQLLKSFVPDRTTVMLSVRQTLSSSWAQRYQEAGLVVEDYRDTVGQITPRVGVIHVVQVDSLRRLAPCHIDVLVLDEVESVMAQLNSSQLRDATAVKLKFMEICKRSEQVVALDGQLQESTINMLEKLTGNTAEITWNNRKTYEGYESILRRFGRKGTDHMINEFINAIGQGKKVVGHINSLTILEEVTEAVRQRFPEKNIVTYHGENNRVEKAEDGSSRYHFQRKRQDLENVSTAFKAADLLLWTGTITCGVDFNEEHFDLNISCFSNNCNTMQAFAQGLFRVRQLRDKRFIIYLEKTDAEFTAAPKDIFDEWAENSNRFDVAGEHLNSDLFNFQIWSLAFERAVSGRPHAYLVSTLNQLGINMTAQNLDKAAERSREIAKNMDINVTGRVSANMIMEAKPIGQLAVDYWLEKNEARASQMLEQNAVDENLSGNMKTIGFIATVMNRRLEDENLLGPESKFRNETNQQFGERKQKLVAAMNQHLKEIQ